MTYSWRALDRWRHNWAKFVEDRTEPWSTAKFPITFTAKGKKWDMKHVNRCIVGEAHGRTGIYTEACEECDAYCYILLEVNLPGWNRKLASFLTHFENEHL